MNLTKLMTSGNFGTLMNVVNFVKKLWLSQNGWLLWNFSIDFFNFMTLIKIVNFTNLIIWISGLWWILWIMWKNDVNSMICVNFFNRFFYFLTLIYFVNFVKKKIVRKRYELHFCSKITFSLKNYIFTQTLFYWTIY